MYDIIFKHRAGDTFQLDGRCDYRKRGETLSKRSLRLSSEAEKSFPNMLMHVSGNADEYRQAYIIQRDIDRDRDCPPCLSKLLKCDYYD